MDNDFFARWRPSVLSLLRIVTGFLFVVHGTQKMLSFPSSAGFPIQTGSLPWWAGIIELAFGALFLIGLLTRFSAFICSGEMAVAYFKGHASGGFWPLENKGELAVLYCFVFLYFIFAGAGPLSIDALFRRKPAIEP